MSLPILEAAPKPSRVPVLDTPKLGVRRGPERRLGQLRSTFQLLPAMTLRNWEGVTFHACGRCFQKLGDDPFDGHAGVMTAGVPKDAHCAFCGHKAAPLD